MANSAVTLDGTSIGAFWEWFSANENRIALLVDPKQHDKTFAASVGEKVTKLHRTFGWEVGHGVKRPLYFALSPKRDLQRLRDTEKVIAGAPDISRWEFHAARPIKQWNMQFRLMSKGRTINVDFSTWRYSLVAFNEREFFDLELFVKPMGLHESLSAQKRLQDLGEFLAEAELGEEFFIRRIGRVSVCIERNDPHEVESTSVSHLRDHILSLA